MKKQLPLLLGLFFIHLVSAAQNNNQILYSNQFSLKEDDTFYVYSSDSSTVHELCERTCELAIPLVAADSSMIGELTRDERKHIVLFSNNGESQILILNDNTEKLKEIITESVYYFSLKYLGQ